jgi:predicted dehydrogenase
LDLTRRNLLRYSAAPLIVPSRVFGAAAPSNRMQMAFIGTGNNGYGSLRQFMGNDRVKVVAVCDVNREGPGYWDGTVRGYEPARRMVDRYYADKGCAVTTDYRELLDRSDIDAVYIATPDHWHCIQVLDACAARKHIFCQKPLSLAVAEGRMMSDAVRKSGVTFQTGSQQRSDPHFHRACELVRNGVIGKLHAVRVGLPGGIPDFGKVGHLTQQVPVPPGFDYQRWLGPAPDAPYCPARVGVNFRWNRNYSGGQVTDWGAHHIDIAQWGIGAELSGPTAIRNARGKFATHPIYNAAVEFSFECEYPNGVRMFVSDKERSGVRFEGSDGWIWCDRGKHDSSSATIWDARIPANGIRLYQSFDHVTNFVDCVFSKKPTAAPVEVAHRSITVAHLGNIAMLTGRDLRWDPVRETIVDDPAAADMLKRPWRAPYRPR